MKEKFYFDKVGKRMPYKVPSGFFDTITENTIAAAESKARGKHLHMPELWRAWSVAASVAALLLVSFFLYPGNSGKPQTEQTIAEAVNAAAATPDSLILSAPAPAVANPVQPRLVPVPQVKAAKTPAPQQKQQLARADEPETLEEILASISDGELLQLTAIASSEEYVIEQTIN